MRVLLVSHRFPPGDGGGVERYTQSLAEQLVRAGDTVSIVVRRPDGSVPEPWPVRERLPDGTVLYRMVGGKQIDFNLFLAHNRRLEQLFTAALVEAAPDVVHINHLLGLSPRFVAIARRLRVPVVISLHDFYFACPRVHLQKRSGELCAGPQFGRECARTCFAVNKDGPPNDPAVRWGLRALYFRRLLALAHRLVSGSRYVASYFEPFVPGRAPIRVIPNGVPLEALARLPGPPSSPRRRGTLNLAYCGTVVPHKGVHVILDALRVADVGPVDLLVMGRVPEEKGIPEYVQDLRDRAAAIPGLTLRVHGAFTPAEFPTLLGDRDFVVVPSLVPEAGPQAPREALAQGVPVLASRLGGLPETVAEGDNGFTFDPARPVELAAVLRRVLSDDGLMSRLREGARRTPVVTVAEHAAAMRAVYQEAIDASLHDVASSGMDLAEVNFLHEALVGVGFAGTKAG
jgi:glycosyltransferase involved in cell wall biosynthesis